MESNKKIYINIIAFSLFCLLLIAFFIYPTIQDIKKNSNDFVSAKNDIITLDAQNIETKNFKKDYESYKPNLEKIDELFVDSQNPVDFIQFLENTATSSQVALQTSLLPNLDSKQFIIFQLNSKGGFSDILSFIKKIETGPYLIDIDSLTIQSSQKINQFEGIFSIKVFIKNGTNI